eukprot:81152-Prymnesium_polylepis.1
MMLLSAAAADTLHPPAAVGAFGRLDGVRARAASLFATMREDTSAACGSRQTTSGSSQCARSSSADALGAEEVDNPPGGAKS